MPRAANHGSWVMPAKWWGGTANSGPAPNVAAWMAPATLVATTSGTRARVENSNSSSSIASTTAASGVPNVAAMPAAAPAASMILRSLAETCRTCPSSEPMAPPVTMIGPSAPNGPPVPMATAADSGLAIAVRGATRLWRTSTASIASGMPWPRMIGDQRARRLTTVAPSTAATTINGDGSRSLKLGTDQPHWWNRNRLVNSPIRWTRTHAAPPAAAPMIAASTASRRWGMRESVRRATT